MAHDPMDHVVDEIGHWTFFTELFDHPIVLPLLDLRPHGIPFTLTKFMLLELVAAGLIIAIYVPLARRAQSGAPPRGLFWNCFESLLAFVRDNIAVPTLSNPHPHEDTHGHEHPEQSDPAHDENITDHGVDMKAPTHAPTPHDDSLEVDRYVPFLWTLFLFILTCNLLGMLPLMGSPTANIWVTGALAVCAFVMMHGAAIAKMGFKNYLISLWPAMEIPIAVGCWLKPMIFVIEVLGTVIKAGVLAVRLFANLFAGHLVLANILMFIVVTNKIVLGEYLWGGVTVASVFGVIALSLLELFVAFLQAYIFTFLTALFMGMALHPQH